MNKTKLHITFFLNVLDDGLMIPLYIQNQIFLYNQILKPVWMYGIQLSGCATDSCIKCIQIFLNKVLRCIVHTSWFIRNKDIHKDLKIPLVKDKIKKTARKHKVRLVIHINIEAQQLLNNNALLQ